MLRSNKAVWSCGEHPDEAAFFPIFNMNPPSIYVQIPAYRDKELVQTLREVFGKAKIKSRVFVAVFWQREAHETLPDDLLRNKRLTVFEVPYWESKGCNWARRILQQNYQGQTYTLFLDSHHRLTRHWDSKLIEMMEDLKASGIAKPIITAYLPSYDPEKEPAGRMNKPLKIHPLPHHNGVLSRLTSYPIPLWNWIKKPITAEYISLHFLCADGRFNEEIEFDEEIYFFGDEVLVSLKAYTHGYELFHPHKVLGWHLYNRATRTPHWNDHLNWTKQEEASQKKLKKIFTGKMPEAIGTCRTVKDYESHIGQKLYKMLQHGN